MSLEVRCWDRAWIGNRLGCRKWAEVEVRLESVSVQGAGGPFGGEMGIGSSVL